MQSFPFVVAPLILVPQGSIALLVVVDQLLSHSNVFDVLGEQHFDACLCVLYLLASYLDD